MQPNPLDSLSRRLANLLDIQMVGITVFARSGLAIGCGTLMPDDTAGEEFLQYYQYINPFRRYWQTAPEGRIIDLSSIPVENERERVEFYSRYAKYLDIDFACMMLNTPKSRFLLNFMLPKQPAARQSVIKYLASLRSDLLFSFEIASNFVSAANLAAGVIDGLDQQGISAAVLSGENRIENANDSMKDMLDAGHILVAEHGRLFPGASTPVPGLTDLLHRTRQSGTGGRLSYTDSSGSRRGSITAFPAPASPPWEGAGESKVVLLVTDSLRRKHAEMDMLRKVYGLTGAEARVASLLRDGKTPAQIAVELQVQPNSVRAHLKAAYAKTGTHSQVELLNILQSEHEPPTLPS